MAIESIANDTNVSQSISNDTGISRLARKKHKITGGFVTFSGREYYQITNFHEMPPFFISLASSSDIFMYLSSNGSLTAGRQSIDNVIFPYETDDKIHLNTTTGPKTIIKIKEQSGNAFWEPFGHGTVKNFDYRRNLYKSIWGNSIIYEEINDTLQLSFYYQWDLSERFGLVRTSCFKNLGKNKIEAEILDGVLNILPSGLPATLNDIKSCLTDAYKAAELDEKTGLAVYSLTSKINDVPEPVEILNANIAYSICGTEAVRLLSAAQIRDFAEDLDITTELQAVGRKGAYLTCLKHSLEPAANKVSSVSWTTILDVSLTHKEITALQKELSETDSSSFLLKVNEDITESTRQLIAINSSGDALQCTGDEAASKHHYVNVLYNNMRGGIFDNGYLFEYPELLSFIKLRNKALLHKHEEFFEDIKSNPDIIYLKQRALQKKDADLIRICYEFLPICFSRRHGDPSRPWNKFFIKLKDEEGKRIYHYEGNWRDIFQNWESMCLSFPDYLENIIVKFLNASTADGYNPYRISREGIDWEVPDPEDPFSGLGYWGDHQIIYLLRLLEALKAYAPLSFNNLFDMDFSYANVPYCIKPYESILKNSKSTVEFDWDKHNQIIRLAEEMGSDGRLILRPEKETGSDNRLVLKLEDDLDSDNKPDLAGSRQVYYVSFMEKLMVPILAKIANLAAGGGIWLNTERPEWNDANNALVGNGLSMVTVYQLRRHIWFLSDAIESRRQENVLMSNEVVSLFMALKENLRHYMAAFDYNQVNSSLSRQLLDVNGYAFGGYRRNIYGKGFSTNKTAVLYEDIYEFYKDCLMLLDYTIDLNKRADGMYHAYNILGLSRDSLRIKHLSAMLEGQTAIAASGRLKAGELLSLVEAMEQSDMYSREQKSFYLYPIKRLKTFMERNSISREDIASSKLLSALLEEREDSLIYEDASGTVRFHYSITSLKQFEDALKGLKARPEALGRMADKSDIIEKEHDLLCEIFDHVFLHKEFTGRSGRMYKYEGIGCIYWHQNAKFLLSIAEGFMSEAEALGDEDILPSELVRLREAYYRLREGLGFNKDPETFGAFPLDPYSHTPYLQGAQQPGMTGQVKEEILLRRLELGISVRGGCLRFNPRLLRKREFLNETADFEYIDLSGEKQKLMLSAGELAFTLCQIPVVYRLSKENQIIVKYLDGRDCINSLCLDEEISRMIFTRDRSLKIIIVHIKESYIMC